MGAYAGVAHLIARRVLTRFLVRLSKNVPLRLERSLLLDLKTHISGFAGVRYGLCTLALNESCGFTSVAAARLVY